MGVPLIFKNFSGGQSTDLKFGIKNSFAYSQALDFRKAPSQLTVLPGLAREDNGIVKDLIQNEVMTSDGTIYAIGSAGAFYKRTGSGVWSKEADVNVGTYGLDYRKDTDAIYIPTSKSVSLYSNVSTSTAAMYMNYYAASYSTSDNSATVGFNVAAYQAGSSLTTTPLTSITENNTSRRYFQSDIEPLMKISVFVVNKGTGNWTLTLHDGTDTVLGTATVTNANLVNNTFNDFTFTSATNGQIRIYVAPNARTYHFHVTSTVADGTLSSSQTNNLSSADCEIWADRLIKTNNGMHPMARFLQYEVFGNGNYVSVWEPISSPPTNDEWERHRLVFPSEYEVCGLAVQNEFLVVALEKLVTGTSTRQQDGLLAFWDGTSPTYNYFVRVPEGSPQAVHEYKNVIYYFAGGDWFAIASPTTQPVKVRSMPGSATEYSGSNADFRVYPYSATVRRGIHLMGYPSQTTNTSVNFGVYSYGAVDKNFPDSFGYSYVMSTGSQNYSVSNNLMIGMVKNFGDLLHVSWQDTLNGGYGVDFIDNTSSPASTSSWQSLIFDAGAPTKTKNAMYMKISYTPLPVGVTVTPMYSINRGAWVSGQAFSNTVLYKSRTDYCRLDIPESEFTEIQLGMSITSTTLTPTITSVALWFDPNRDQDEI